MKDTNETKSRGSNLMKLGMTVCCIVMVLPILLLLSSGVGLGWQLTNWAVFLPLGICLGMHIVMHKMMGKSCHGDHEKQASNQNQDDR